MTKHAHCSLFTVQCSIVIFGTRTERVQLHAMKDRTYKDAGVDSAQQDRIMHDLSYWVEQTFRFRPNTVKLPLGYFANAIVTIDLSRILTGQDTKEGDVIVGLRSTGVHSNGLTLARRVFFTDHHWSVDKYLSELGRTIGEELLEPTAIYVKEVVAMLEANLKIKQLGHITSTGTWNQ